MAVPAITLILLLTVTVSAGAQSTDRERQLLLDLKSYWNDPSSLISWSNTTTTPHCEWTGVSCTGTGHVENITLQHKNIDGDVPTFLCSITNLSVLDLYDNSIRYNFPGRALSACQNLTHLNLAQNLLVGPIPADIDEVLSPQLEFLNLSGNNFSGDIPPAIANLTALTELYLDNNLFNGSFPPEIGKMEKLKRLTLANNPFAPAQIPPEFGNLKKLSDFWMAEANLIGPIPDSFEGLTELQNFDLSKNGLTGTIPAGIWSIKSLELVYLYKNNLSGGIPTIIGATKLVAIDLSMNQLNGSIPDGFGKLQKLEVLFLYYNQFSGEIPAGIGNLTNLYDVRLFGNQLTGRLPSELGRYSKLWNLEVSENSITGELPPDLCGGGTLNSLVVFSNNLTGSVPDSLASCGSLVNIQLYNNHFSGDFPSQIWSLMNLSTVIVHDNNLSGKLPDRLSWNFTRLDIRNNLFSGRIPSDAKKLKVFRASGNGFSGALPIDMTGLSSLQELLLDENKITGPIPNSIEKLQSLTNLNLSSNQLSGEIPKSIGSLQVLTSLDLSNNHISGEIPPTFSNLRLNSLNLSSNSLTGPIPASLQNAVYSNGFLSNPGLCSGLPDLNLPTCVSNSKRPDLSKGLVALVVVLSITVFIATTVFALLALRDIRRRKHRNDISKWTLTSFHTVSFSESNVLAGLTPENVVGSGGSGEVYRVPLGDRIGEIVAVKKIWNSKSLDTRLEKEFQAEVDVLGSIRHLNILKLLCYISGDDAKLLVYEYMENGSLDEWLHGKRRGYESLERQRGLDWPMRQRIAVGVAQGLCYMHHDCRPAIVHRDVKSSNILLDAEFNPKVADFGLARIMLESGKPDTVSALAGSFGYMAPECAYTRRVNEKADVYCFGVVLLELTTGRPANDGNGSLADWAWQHFQSGGSVAQIVDDHVSDPMSLEEISMVMRLGLICTGKLPSARPSMKEVVEILLRCSDDDRVAPKFNIIPLLKKGSRRKKDSSVDDDDGLLRNV